MSPALLACLYAHSLSYWSSSCKLVSCRRPDQRFIWNLANEALFLEMRLGPSISTIAAILLNISGRPTSMIFNNAGQLGFAVAMAYTPGLHKDPTPWDIPTHEKTFRVNVWRALVVLDKCLAFDVPPLIRINGSDVPLPSLEQQCFEKLPENERRPKEVYIHLVTLTEDVLTPQVDLLYSIKENLSIAQESKDQLQAWVDSSTGVSRNIVLRGNDLSIPGSANLRLAFLIVKFLQERINLVRDHQGGHVQSALRIAEEVVLFLQELHGEQLECFWLPTMGLALLIVMTFLIRSTLQAETLDIEGSWTMSLAEQMMDALRRHRKDTAWDIADLCIEYYDQALNKILKHRATNDRVSTIELDFDTTTTPFAWENWIDDWLIPGFS